MIIIGSCTLLIMVVVGALIAIRSETGPPRSAEQAVERYLEAVADSRADDALALLANPPIDRSMLTDEMLQTTNARAPMHDIDVRRSSLGNDDWQGEKVFAGYDLGEDEHGSAFFYAEETDEGWKVLNGVMPLRVASGTGKVPSLKANGVPVTGFEPEFFPGWYEFDLDSKWLQLPADSTSTEIGTPYRPDTVETLEYEITPEGERAARKAVLRELDDCFPSRNTFNPGCGLAIESKLKSGEPIVKSSTVWTISYTNRRQFEIADLEIGYDAATIAELNPGAVAEVEATCGRGARRFDCGGSISMKAAQVDLAADEISVVWAD